MDAELNSIKQPFDKICYIILPEGIKEDGAEECRNLRSV